MRTDLHWQRIGQKSHHGCLIPLFSLHSRYGTGTFLDLLPLIDWCKSVHFDVIQLLPLNDTGEDKSPYNPISSCALDPKYLSLPFLPKAKGWEECHFLQQKKVWLRHYFGQTFQDVKKSKEYQTFLQSHGWLRDYALFKAIQEKQESDFYSFLQFHCFQQMECVRKHASKQGVFLKGDIPILISPESADVWAHPELFCLDRVAGAPPDAYNRLGQKWGFPLFNWDAMRAQGYSWWKQRLKVVERLFHIYRIDHVVGFFRIWGIPKDKKASEGSFFPADPQLWERQGREILTMMIDSCSLLPMAEDLGTIPAGVYSILKELGICGIKVLRWQRRPTGDKGYIPYAEYDPLSLSTLSTPDMDPLQVWWEKFPDEAIPFARFKRWVYTPDLTRVQRLEILKDIHHTPSYFHINLLQEYLALFPELVSPTHEEERINVPGTLLPTNWTYQFRCSVEELVAHQPLADTIRQIVS